MIWGESIKENSQNIGLYYEAILILCHVCNTIASAFRKIIQRRPSCIPAFLNLVQSHPKVQCQLHVK